MATDTRPRVLRASLLIQELVRSSPSPRVTKAKFSGFSIYEWETLYAGYRLDESGLYLVRNRALHPGLGNWITRDPIGYADGMSLYAVYFVLNGTDPSGLALPETDWVDTKGHHWFTQRLDVRANFGRLCSDLLKQINMPQGNS